jgi:Glycosyl hydrolase family 20, catalytic domain
MIRAFQWDLARQVERIDVLKKLLPHYARWGYQELYLHLEDAVHYPSLPGVGRTDAYTYQELGEIILTAAKVGIWVVPIVNLLGHTQYLIKHPALRDLNELRDENGEALEHGQICPLHPRMMEVAGKLLTDIAPYCTASKVHVGLDESFHLGKCPRCRDEVARIGLDGHFAGHVQRLHKLCTRFDLRMGIWADMLYFVPEAIAQLPRGITAYDWYYYSFAKKPRVEFFNFAERDLAPALKQQGIAYYGCPMNGAFRHEPLPVFGDRLGNIRSWWQRCKTAKADGFLVTSWEANRLALETTTIVDAAAASLWLEPEIEDNTTLLARGLTRVFKQGNAQSLARSLLAADEHAFSGYARWQINERWDAYAGSESVKPYQAEERFFDRLCRDTHAWPKALKVSLLFRRYLAQRDVFVREAAKNVFKLRRLHQGGKSAGWATQIAEMKKSTMLFKTHLHTGQMAARAMWAQTRATAAVGPNQLILGSDARRADDLILWLKHALKHPEATMQATPLCGVWQLQFMVHNFAPAVQKIVVEQQDANGQWKELASRFTIEFRNQAARPRAKIKREFTTPVASFENKIRIVARGVGQAAISHIALTNGVEAFRTNRFRDRRVVGRKVSKNGFPELNAKPESAFEIKWNPRPVRGF